MMVNEEPMYPESFYGENNFGLWSQNNPRVQADCEVVLAALRAYLHPGLGGQRAHHTALGWLITWAVDRSTYDLPENWGNRDGAVGDPRYHWHTQGALENWQANDERSTNLNSFDHATPRNVVKAGLTALYHGGNLTTWEQVRDYLKPRRAMAVLTVAEHQQLNHAGLGAAMPNPDETANPFARYQAVGIVLLPPLNQALAAVHHG
jgi:hypothetical protein